MDGTPHGSSSRSLMPTVFDPAARSDLLRRLDTVRPDSPRRWGTMSAAQMMAHVGDQLGVGLGEVAAPPPSGPLRFFPINAVVIRWVPWPHGRTPTHPVFRSSSPEGFEANRARVRAHLAAFADRGPAGAFSPHPTFGALSARLWGHLAHRHTDHHLRQFGA